MSAVASRARPHARVAALPPASIRRLRTDLGLSQPAFAQLVHAHPMTVSKWERGEPGYAPDTWQADLMRRFRHGVRARPDVVPQVGALVAAGLIGFALGALLGAALAAHQEDG